MCICCGSAEHILSDCTDPSKDAFRELMRKVRRGLGSQGSDDDEDQNTTADGPMGEEYPNVGIIVSDDEAEDDPTDRDANDEYGDYFDSRVKWRDKPMSMGDIGNQEHGGHTYMVNGVSASCVQIGPRDKYALEELVSEIIRSGAGDVPIQVFRNTNA